MTAKNFNFNLGSRPLTANESTAVEIAKRAFRDSLERHQGHSVAGRAVFKATATVVAEAKVERVRGTDAVAGNVPPKPRGTNVTERGPSTWSTNKVAPANRKY